MARNVEIKARLSDPVATAARAAAIADSGPELILQDDTFYACAHGRLKLRRYADGHGELIAYVRPDTCATRTSDYRIVPVVDPDALHDALERALGLHGRVVKARTLYLAGRTRIHLDRVDGLGDFLELEVVLRDGEDERDGMAEAQRLLDALQVDVRGLVGPAYVDLLREAAG